MLRCFRLLLSTATIAGAVVAPAQFSVDPGAERPHSAGQPLFLPTGRYLAVGSNESGSADVPSLRAAEGDAKRFASMMEGRRYLGETLLGSAGTRSAILGAIKNAAQSLGPQDEFVF